MWSKHQGRVMGVIWPQTRAQASLLRDKRKTPRSGDAMTSEIRQVPVLLGLTDLNKAIAHYTAALCQYYGTAKGYERGC